MFPCGTNKAPLTAHGFYDATTDRARVNGYWNANPGAMIGVPTGERSGVFVVDVDRVGAMGELEAKIGKLPKTRTVRTPRGGKHLYFRHRAGITNSPGALPKGIDVRGEGGYVLVPPSAGYGVEDRSPVAEAPAELLELLEGRSRSGEPRAAARERVPAGEVIEEGSRNQTLFFVALDRKDAGRGQAEALAELLAINAARCSPPLDAGEVEEIARSAFRFPVRRRDPSPEVLEAVERLEAEWRRRIRGGWKGVGGKTDRDVYRVQIELGRRYGRLREDGSVTVSASVRSVALAAATSFATVSGGATKRLAKAGLVRKIDAGRGAAQAASWVLLPPRNHLLTHKHPSSPGEREMLCVKDQLRPRLWDLETPAFRWRGPVGKGRATVLYLLELEGPMGLEALADAMGWGNRRELRRRYLVPLAELGLVEDRGGVYALHGDHRGRVEEVRRIRHGGGERKVRRKTPEGRIVTVVEEFDPMSEEEREERDRRRYEEHSRRFREALEAKERTPEGVTHLLNRWDEEREAPAGDPGLRDISAWVEEPPPEPAPSSPTASLTDGEMADLDAILAYELAHGSGSFGWDRASCKRLFYGGPVRGRWPDPETLARIKAAYDELEGVAA